MLSPLLEWFDDHGRMGRSGGFHRTADTSKPPEAKFSILKQADELWLILEGHWYADRLLEELGPIFRRSSHDGELVLDLSATLGLDDLALSAVVVLLRTYCDSFRAIKLRLHQPWAMARLVEHGSRGVLGAKWAAGFEAGVVRFSRRDLD
jgi:hypothetical protein